MRSSSSMTSLHWRVGQLAGVTLARGGQAVHARQVAGVRQLPGQADRCVEAVLELVDQPGNGLHDCHRLLADPVIWDHMLDAARRAHAGRAPPRRRRHRPPARGPGVGVGVQRLTTSTIVGFFRNESLRVPKWYSRAPKGSGRTATWRCNRQRASGIERGRVRERVPPRSVRPRTCRRSTPLRRGSR